MSDVFISYSRKDIAFARLLHNALEESQLEAWIDGQDIPATLDFRGSGERSATCSPEKPTYLCQPHTRYCYLINSLSWRPDSKQLASASRDGTVIIWDLDPDSWVSKTCLRAGRSLSPAEWQIYYPGEPYRSTCLEYD